MVGCVLSQLKPSELYILICGKGLGFEIVKLLGLYPIQKYHQKNIHIDMIKQALTIMSPIRHIAC